MYARDDQSTFRVLHSSGMLPLRMLQKGSRNILGTNYMDPAEVFGGPRPHIPGI